MAIKLFVTDLDGTLLNSEHQISAANKQAIAEMAEQGVIATIATGRMYVSALPYAQQLGLDVPIITYNGALVKSVSGRIYHADYLEPEAVRTVYQYAFERGLYVHSYAKDTLYFHQYDDKAVHYENAAGLKGQLLGDKISELVDEVPKMLIITDSEAETDRLAADLNEHYGDKLFAVKSNPNYIEIVKPGVSKAHALDILIKQFGLSRAETMAIGDSNNDLPMLKTAGLSIAMGNAGENIKAVCDGVTGSCDESGVAMAIRKYVLAAE